MKTSLPSRSALARRFAPVVAMIIATALHSTAAEAEKEPQAPFDSHLVELPELVVTARRVEEHPLDVPAYTNVITREQIEQSGASNLIELLKSQANLSFVSLSSSPTNTKVSMRGTGTDGNGRTLVLVDGIRANRPDMGDFNWLQFAVQDIESIEVIQGPQGGYYGDNAVGGVIKINTRHVPDKSGGQVSVLVGSNQTVKTSGAYTQTTGNAWATVSGGHDESDGYRDHSGYTADSGAVKVGYDNKKNSVTQVGVSYIETHYEQPQGLSLAQYNENPKQAGGSDPTQYADGWSKTYRVTGSNQFGAKDQNQVLTDAAYFSTKEYANQRAWFDTFNRKMEGGSFSPKAVVKFEQASLTPGLDLNYDQLDFRAGSGPNGDLSRSVIAPYIGGEYAACKTVAVSGVVRHEFNRMEAESSNPTSAHAKRTEAGNACQLAVNYRPTKTIRLYAKYDHTYRFPATDEVSYYQGFSGGPSGTVFFNQNLKPESSDNVELGADHTMGFWRFGGAGYHMQTRDEIAYNSTTFLNENIGLVERNGVQAHMGYDNGTTGFRARADYVSARIKENTIPTAQQSGQLPMTPVWQITETVFYRPIMGCTIELTHRFTDSSNSTYSQTPANMIKLPPTNMFDSKITYQLTRDWVAFLGVNNLTDQKSMSAAYNTDWDTHAIYPGEGRFMYLGSNYKF